MKEESFHSILCAECLTLLISACLEVTFPVSISPETETIGKVPTLTGNGKATSHHLFHQVFFCRRDPASLGLSGSFVEMQDTP